MWLYFSLGFFVALISLWIYVEIVKGKLINKIVNKQPIYHLVEGSKDIIYRFEVRPEAKFTYLSLSIDQFLGEGVRKEGLENSNSPFNRIHPDDYESLRKKLRGEIDYSQILMQRWKDTEGNYRWFEEYATPIYRKGELIAVQGIMRNIDEKMKLQQDLEYRINHDALTDIHNREYFQTLFKKYNEQANMPVAIILLDLDELKYTNDRYGHKAGDDLIKRTAKLLNQFSADNVTVARLGGDEFVILIAGQHAEASKQMLQRVLKIIEENNESSSNIPIKISVGYAFSANSIGQLSNLFSDADRNMYSNKTERKQLLYK